MKQLEPNTFNKHFILFITKKENLLIMLANKIHSGAIGFSVYLQILIRRDKNKKSNKKREQTLSISFYWTGVGVSVICSDCEETRTCSS